MSSELKSFSVRSVHRWLPFRLGQLYGQEGYESGEHRFDWWYYQDDFWKRYIGGLAEDGFNALFLWNLHPHPALIDYDQFPEAAFFSKAETGRNIGAFRSILDIAHGCGVALHVMQYLVHFPEGFAKARGYGLVHAGYGQHDNREARGYCRYANLRLFETYPDLDGMMFCGETNQDAFDFIRETIVEPLNALARKPALHFRLWGAHFAEDVIKLRAGYGGPFHVCEKINRENHTVPRCDPRIGMWIRDLPGIAMMALMGPGNAAGCNLRSLFWGSPDFTCAILRSAAELGVTQIGLFQDCDNFLVKLEGPPRAATRERKHYAAGWLARKCVAHYARHPGERFNHEKWVQAVRKQYALPSDDQARDVYSAMEDASMLLTQAGAAADQSYAYASNLDAAGLIGRFSEGTLQNLPGDFQLAGPYRYPIPRPVGPVFLPITDYCENPGAEGITPLATAAEQEQRANRIRGTFSSPERFAGAGEELSWLREYALLNAEIGRFNAHAFRSSTAFYQVLLAGSPEHAQTLIRAGMQERWEALAAGDAAWRMTLGIPLLQTDDGPAWRIACRCSAMRKELVGYERLLRWFAARDEFTFDAFLAYAESLRIFLRIGRHIRPGMHLSAATIANASRMLDEALLAARRAFEMESAGPRIRGNISRWIEHIDGERRRMNVPIARCAIGGGEGTELRLTRDAPPSSPLPLAELMLAYFGEMPAPAGAASYWPVFRLFWSGDALRIRAAGLPLESRVGDPIGVFIDPDATGARFFSFLTSAGKWREPMRMRRLAPPFALKPDESWKSEYQVAAADDGVEITVPLRQMGCAPRVGGAWGFNLSFNIYTNEAQAHDWMCMGSMPGAWSAMFSGVWPVGAPARFGRIIFVE